MNVRHVRGWSRGNFGFLLCRWWVMKECGAHILASFNCEYCRILRAIYLLFSVIFLQKESDISIYTIIDAFELRGLCFGYNLRDLSQTILILSDRFYFLYCFLLKWHCHINLTPHIIGSAHSNICSSSVRRGHYLHSNYVCLNIMYHRLYYAWTWNSDSDDWGHSVSMYVFVSRLNGRQRGSVMVRM